MCGTLFLHVSTSLGCFCVRTIFSKKQTGVTSDLPYMRFTYYSKNNQQGVPVLATDSPCIVWGHCLLYHGPLLGLGFLLSVAVKNWYDWVGFCYEFLVFIHVLYITQVLPIIFPLKLIYPQNVFLY